MLSVLYCLQNDHDPRLVVLAGLICVAASTSVVILLRHARDGTGRDRTRWLAAAGLASGFGIWATHFIAMLGYDPGIVLGYALAPTGLSLIVAVATTTLGFSVALKSPRRTWRWPAGVVVGLGFVATHYLGMQAVQLPGELRWSAGHVLASILFAIVPVVPALSLALDRHDLRSAIAAAMLIVLAILLLHFTGMAGITVMPGALDGRTSGLLSPIGMGVAVACTAFAVLTFGMLAALMSGRARAAISESEREFRILVQGISDCAIYMLSADGRVASWNAGAQRLKGYSTDEAIGREYADFYSPEDRAAGLPQRNIASARQAGKLTAEGWRYRKDGSRFWAHVSIESVYDDRGVFRGFAKITRDMTLHKERQDNLDAALANMHQGLCLFGPDERLVVSNPRVGEIFDLTPDACPPGTRFMDVLRLALERRARGPVPDVVMDEVLARHRAMLAQPGGGTMVIPFTPSCTLSITHRPMDGGGWVTTFDDITERRKAEQRIEHMALHDGLTGLPNRGNFTARLDAAVEEAGRQGSRVAVVGIDLNRFKEINDTHGHAVGDAVLRDIADRMTAVLRPDELVARFGGDEFTAYKPFDDDAALDDFIGRLHACLTRPVELDGLAVFNGASMGVAVYPADGETREQVVNNADLAMYRAKEAIGRQICRYERGMDEAVRARRVIANDLREAMNRGELSLAYQVQKDVTTETVTGYEALLRWRHPRDGWIAPAEFIPIAEESGEILRIGEWVLRTACKEAARWPEPWKIAVNLSPIQLMHVGLFDIVTAALVESGLSASRLELEITETAFIADKVRALHVLRRIKALGVTIAIDDFGTGYSSLDTLNSFPFDKIKIDKSFLLESESSHQARAIIRAVLALGRSLAVPVLAEGLESEDQLRLLRSEGCNEAQGYLWGRPMALPPSGQASGGAIEEAA